MTYEELKKAAGDMGYNLIKKQPYIALLKHCGVKPHEWFAANTARNGTFYKCPVCGMKTEEMKTERQARTAWNNLIREGENGFDKS